MIEFVPYMLFTLGVHPDHPGEVDLHRPEILFATQQDCEEAGAKMAERMTAAASDKSGATYTHRCLPVPQSDEFNEALDQMKKRGQ